MYYCPTCEIELSEVVLKHTNEDVPVTIFERTPMLYNMECEKCGHTFEKDIQLGIKHREIEPRKKFVPGFADCQ